MVFKVWIPGWMTRKYVIRQLEQKPWIMGMPDKRTKEFDGSFLGLVGFELAIETSYELPKEVREFIANGAAEAGCDSLAFAKTAKKFPGAWWGVIF